VTIVDFGILPKPAAMAAANLFFYITFTRAATAAAPSNLQIVQLAYLRNNTRTKVNRYRGQTINLRNENPMKCYITIYIYIYSQHGELRIVRVR